MAHAGSGMDFGLAAGLNSSAQPIISALLKREQFWDARIYNGFRKSTAAHRSMQRTSCTLILEGYFKPKSDSISDLGPYG